MTIHDWIGVLWLIAIITLYAYAYHIHTQHIKHKENSRQIVQDLIKAEKRKKEQQEQSQPAHIRIQNAIHQAHQRQATATQYQNQEQWANLWAQWAKHIHENINKDIEYLEQWENPTNTPQKLNNLLNNHPNNTNQ